MRFMLCARDRVTGTMQLVGDESYETRGEAVEAVSVVRDLSGLTGSDIFLVDLDLAVPVAVVPWRAGQDSEAEADDAAEPEPAEDEPEPEPEMGFTLGMLQIDIEAWTCEDCIYVSTCDFSGTRRPAECASFQWRA